jgi:5-formyltetrahydrofolate cyclo-ligase
MHRFSVVPETDSAPPRYRPNRLRTGVPLYREVYDSVEELVMSIPLGDERPLAPETQLMSTFGVSRGTLRRALDELVRQDLLRVEPGRGTFVVQSTKVRWLVWDRLVEVARPDSRFDMDVSRFVPDFEGRERCDIQVQDLPDYAQAAVVFIAPDNSLEALRLDALRQGKRLVVPTFGLRRGLVALDGARLSPADMALAATLDGMERLGTVLTLHDLRQLEPVGVVLTGAVAVTRQGLHFGGGDGYFDLEWALLRHCGLASPTTAVVAVIHSCQLLDVDVRPGHHDAVADLIITPEGAVAPASVLPKPDGLRWEEFQAGIGDSKAYVSDLLSEITSTKPAAIRHRAGARR